MLGLCWHSWSKWIEFEAGRTYSVSMEKPDLKFYTGYYVAQRRDCSKCDKRQLRTVTTKWV